MPIYQLTDEIMFPNPELAEEDGLLAIGGDLRWERLVLAYCNGIFPWYNEDDPILWWCTKPRFIIKPNEVRISKSMKRVFNRGEFKVTFNNDFDMEGYVIDHIDNNPKNNKLTNLQKITFSKNNLRQDRFND